MSTFHTEWGRIWIVTKWAMGPRETWPRLSYQDQTQFHIHDARHLLTTVDKTQGWHILHAFGFYPPEDHVGVPSHVVNRNLPRAPRPEGVTFINEASVPPDHNPHSHDPSGV
jgi:hypothetical protein